MNNSLNRIEQTLLQSETASVLTSRSLRPKGREPINAMSLESKELRQLAEEMAELNPELVKLLTR